MAGLYIHVPFCKQACYYCDFHFSTNLTAKDEMVQALCTELAFRAPEFFGTTFKSVYFGGGTPSHLPISDLEQILNTAFAHYKFEPTLEITLETNPDDHDLEHCKAWQSIGINRLSIGIQSFDDQNLQAMNRAHNAIQGERSIKEAQDSGFENLTIDIIYGMATSSDEVLERDLQKAIQFDIPHISAYCLTIEPNTAFGKWTEEGRVYYEENHATTQMTKVFNFLPANDRLQYEISNFAKLGYESVHNSAYWQGLPYLGIRPSAHSYDGKLLRKWNIKNNAKYIRKILEDRTVPFEHEYLTQQQRANELIITKLRTKDGLPYNDLFKLGFDLVTKHGRKIMYLQNQGLVWSTPSHLYITTTGRFFADGISQQLML